MSDNKDKILECIVAEINTVRKISEHLDICKGSIDLLLRKMRQEKIIESTNEGRINVFRLAEIKTYHDPFGLCRTQSQDKTNVAGSLRLDAKAGLRGRTRHSIDDKHRSEQIIESYCRQFREYGKPASLRDII